MKCFIFVSFPPDAPNCDKLLVRRNGKSKPSSLLGNWVQTFHKVHLRSQNLHLLRSNLALALTYRKKAVSWVKILKLAVWMVSMSQEGLTARNIIYNTQRHVECVDHRVKQHSPGADLKTSHGKNADIGSVWFGTKARGNSESSVLKLKKKMQWSKDEQAQIARKMSKDWTHLVNYVRKERAALDQSYKAMIRSQSIM